MSGGTRIDPTHTRRFGCPELHAIFFQHRADRGGLCSVVSVQIPEAEHLLERAAKEARRCKARVMLLCDTGEQAKEVRRRAARLLPQHREVSMARAEAGAWRVQ